MYLQNLKRTVILLGLTKCQFFYDYVAGMSRNSRSQFFPKTLQSMLSQLELGTLFFILVPNPKSQEYCFFIPIPIPKIWEQCFSFPFPIPNKKKNTFGILLGNQVFSIHSFSVLGVKFTLNKDNLFKLNNRHEFAQLGRLNIVLKMEEAFYNSQLHSQLFGK